MGVFVPTDIDASALEAPKLPVKSWHWARRLRSPVWLCFLLLALCVRVWLVIHTHGFVDADEALLGVQAQHILQGERPSYYYGQPYMGSLEAYLVAIVFALAGSSLWTLRIVPIVLSLVVVWLTWCLARALVKRVSLPSSAQKCFVWSATLVAVCPPLYNVVIELRTWGGHIEAYVIMQLLLLAALHLMDRWKAGAPARELAVRWALIGFLIGLGFWIYPLVIYAVVVAVIWMVCGIVILFLPFKKRPQCSPLSLLKDILLSFIALPAALLGSAPALYWGANHHWENIAYILQQSNHEPFRVRIQTIWYVAQFYHTCLAERVIGGGVAVEDAFQQSIHTWLWYAALFCFVMTVLLFASAWVMRSSLLMQMSRAVTFPLLFGIGTVMIFCASSAATIGLQFPCSQDFVGRYAAPIVLVLPFFFAATLTVSVLFLHKCEIKEQMKGIIDEKFNTNVYQRFFFVLFRLAKISIVLFFVVYIVLHAYCYRLSDAGHLFQSPYCLDAPADNSPLITYLEREHIRYAWATNFVGNPITFKTNSRITAVDPTGVLNHIGWLNRIPDYTEAVHHADRPSIILLIPHDDGYPQLLHILDRDHIIYRVARFPSQPWVDIMVVAPLNRSVPLLESPQDFGNMFVCMA